MDRNLKKFIAGYAHLYAYDFNMMKIILKKCGFKSITNKNFCDSKINFKFTGFDKDPFASLIIEAKKDKFKRISKNNNINKSNKNYNDYAFSLLFNKSIKSSLKAKKIRY